MNFSMPYCSENKRFFARFYAKFSLTIFKRKDEIFVVLQRKQAISQFFVEDVYFFQIISCKKRDQRIADLLYGNNGSRITINLLKICSQKLEY